MNRNQPTREPQIQDEVVHWYRSMPPCTKFLFTSFIAITTAGRFGLFDPIYLVFFPSRVVKHLEIWRLFTSFFIQDFNLNAAIQLYFMYSYSKDLETTRFAGRTADYVYFLLIESVLILIGGWLNGLIVLNQSLVMSIIYLWSKHHSEIIVSFLFGLRFKGKYLPFVLVAFESLQMNATLPWASIVGLLTGHVYYYFSDVYPTNGGPRLLTTPRWLYSIFPQSFTPTQTSFGTTIYPNRLNQQSQRSTNTNNWGRGHRLGQ